MAEGPASPSAASTDVPPEDEAATFDFESHRAEAEDKYRRVRGTYQDFASIIKDILVRSLNHQNVLVHSIESRAKEIASFGKKATRPDPSDPENPKYPNPIHDITDLAAARVITFFLSTLEQTDAVITSEFEIIERNDRGGEATGEARLGYQSIHYLVKLKENRLQLPEYARFRGLIAELQVRTILQHAWAEIEHEIQYKAADVDVLPESIRRRFLSLAGMLEIGDREFQAIADQHQELQQNARERVASGELEGVEITPDSLQALLDKEYGEDGRMREWSYTFATRLLKRLGFTTLKQVERAMSGYNDDAISRIIHGGRMGQLTRFEDVLLASMGQNFIDNHPWYPTESGWFENNCERKLERLKAVNISVGNYDPRLDALTS
ncbi:GTP pyrophosphokinase [Mycobacterium paraense]|uniref:GTP pyrophosphokinase n=1 Tax=Mycobacterium paraense TaxID=767916 RepID=UPI000A16475F|nr:hypothetical protein [Mycobacterium paraense]